MSLHHKESLPRVLFVNHTSLIGGAEFVLLDVVRGFVENSSVLLFEEGPLRGRLTELGLATAILQHGYGLGSIKRDRSLIRALPRLSKLAFISKEIVSAARNSDVIYANSQKAFVLAALAAPFARRPVIWHLHDILTSDHFGRSQITLSRILANRFAAGVIVPSIAVSAAFVDAGGRPSLTRLVPNGVTFDPENAERLALRDKLGLPSGFIFGVFSRLAPWKGQLVALQALARLPDAHGLIVGSALFGEDQYELELKQKAIDLGVAERTHFLGQRDDVPTLMQAVDVVVHPSTAPEPFGRTLVEAMLCRTPVVAAAAGAVPEILEDGAAGFLVKPGDAVALAAILEKLRTRPALSSGIVDYAERRARTYFGADRMRAEVIAVVREIASRRSRRLTGTALSRVSDGEAEI
jgi:glycosyltransferase involved in cell wall biosynthesis